MNRLPKTKSDLSDQQLQQIKNGARFFCLQTKNGNPVDWTLATGYRHAIKILEAVHGRKFSAEKYILNTFTPDGWSNWTDNENLEFAR